MKSAIQESMDKDKNAEYGPADVLVTGSTKVLR